MKNYFSRRAVKVLLILLISMGGLLWLLINSYSESLRSDLIAGIEGVVPNSKAKIDLIQFEFLNVESLMSGIVLKKFEFTHEFSARPERSIFSVDQFSIRGNARRWLSSSKELAVMIPVLSIEVLAVYQDGSWQVNAVNTLKELKKSAKKSGVADGNLKPIDQKDFTQKTITQYRVPKMQSGSRVEGQRIRFKAATLNIDQSRVSGEVLLPNGETVLLSKTFSIPEIIYCFSDEEDSDVGSAFRFMAHQTLKNVIQYLERESATWDLQPQERQSFLDALSKE